MKEIKADRHLARGKPVCIRLDEEENGAADPHICSFALPPGA